MGYYSIVVCVKGVLFVNESYTKGVPILPRKVYKRLRRWTSGRSLSV